MYPPGANSNRFLILCLKSTRSFCVGSNQPGVTKSETNTPSIEYPSFPAQWDPKLGIHVT